jgi:hypothetical protein
MMLRGYLVNAHKLDLWFEVGPIRPPSEAFSLLIRATRNCPWNRCQFCPVYKGQRFELRPADEVIKDIETAKAIADEIKELAWKMGYGNRVRETAASIYNDYAQNASVRNVALWLWAGGTTAFLQDANSLIMRTPDLVRVVSALKQAFPGLSRITSYARSKTAAKKSVEELRELKDAGLSRLHIGLESGSDAVLSYMNKGVTAEEHIIGGRKVKEAGISLCEYVMPGLGGRKMSAEHARETARVLNEINPDHIRLRTLQVHPQTPLWEKLESGDFELQTEDEIVEEIGEFISRLEVTSELKSDHILNLLPELEGKLPEAKEHCLATISRYFSLPEQERLNFKLGRRLGLYERLDDLNDKAKHQHIEGTLKRILQSGEDVEKVIQKLKTGYL